MTPWFWTEVKSEQIPEVKRGFLGKRVSQFIASRKAFCLCYLLCVIFFVLSLTVVSKRHRFSLSFFLLATYFAT